MATALGEFLRVRRAQAPVQAPGPRRTPGMRREEVAVGAAVSADYYTRLEQGREDNPSDAVLTAVAAALRMSDDDLAYAIRLRDGAHRIPTAVDNETRARMVALVDAWTPNPAYVLDHCSDVVAANTAAFDLFTGLDDPRYGPPNTCRYLLTHPLARERFVDWEEVARTSVAALREKNAGAVSNPRLIGLVDELSGRSEEFRTWWDGHVVGPRRSASKRFRDADGSVFEAPYEIAVFPDEGLRATLYLPGSTPSN